MNEENVLTPVGRIVWGDPYLAHDADQDGKAYVDKNGKPFVKFQFGIAIPKTPNVPWEQEVWGASIMRVANASFPGDFDPASKALLPGREFSFKVQDGDSNIPNKKGNRNCDKTGYPGHWVIGVSNGFAPRYMDKTNQNAIENNLIKCGYFVQLGMTVKSNMSQQTHGVYLNQGLVCFTAYGEEIASGGFDDSGMVFGNAALPAGATLTPPAGITAPAEQPQYTPPQAAAVVPATDLVQTVPGVPTPPVAAGIPTPPVAAGAPTPPPVIEQLFNLNGTGFTMAQLISAGWTEVQISTLPLM